MTDSTVYIDWNLLEAKVCFIWQVICAVSGVTYLYSCILVIYDTKFSRWNVAFCKLLATVKKLYMSQNQYFVSMCVICLRLDTFSILEIVVFCTTSTTINHQAYVASQGNNHHLYCPLTNPHILQTCVGFIQYIKFLQMKFTLQGFILLYGEIFSWYRVWNFVPTNSWESTNLTSADWNLLIWIKGFDECSTYN